MLPTRKKPQVIFNDNPEDVAQAKRDFSKLQAASEPRKKISVITDDDPKELARAKRDLFTLLTATLGEKNYITDDKKRAEKIKKLESIIASYTKPVEKPTAKPVEKPTAKPAAKKRPAKGSQEAKDRMALVRQGLRKSLC